MNSRIIFNYLKKLVQCLVKRNVLYSNLLILKFVRVNVQVDSHTTLYDDKEYTSPVGFITSISTVIDASSSKMVD